MEEKGFVVGRQLTSWSLKWAPMYTLMAKREGASSISNDQDR